ncbi:DUF6266 family protein [Pedobacter jamesrossensis]|uniref:DUF6266 family protein n=1 Tax=Pedobacter jamesrossensis TaxID=1908238 RepID=A0ABV8NKN6_9SPHI
MAILNDGINGGFTGKVGSVIGYQLNGKWIIKGLPKPSKKNKIGSQKQKVCRQRFTVMQNFLSAVIGYIKIGFNLERKARMITAHNAAKSYNMLHAFDDNNEIDYTKIVLTYGDLVGAENPQHFIDDVGLHFTWSEQHLTPYERQSDQVMVLAYNAKNNTAYCLFSGSRRSSGKETLPNKSLEKGSDYHTWISFIADDRMNISMSTYVGCITYE